MYTTVLQSYLISASAESLKVMYMYVIYLPAAVMKVLLAEYNTERCS